VMFDDHLEEGVELPEDALAAGDVRRSTKRPIAAGSRSSTEQPELDSISMTSSSARRRGSGRAPIAPPVFPPHDLGW
jgi:hypothetical protein